MVDTQKEIIAANLENRKIPTTYDKKHLRTAKYQPNTPMERKYVICILKQ